VERRNLKVQDGLIREHSKNVMDRDLRVFCVSNTDYQKHRNEEYPIAKRHSELSGIAGLRKYCQSIPAKAQFRAVTAFLQHQVPTLVGSIKQWILQGSDSMTVEKADAFQRLLNQCDLKIQSVGLVMTYEIREKLIYLCSGIRYRLGWKDILTVISSNRYWQNLVRGATVCTISSIPKLQLFT